MPVPIIKTDDYEISHEYFLNGNWFHITVYRWSKRVRDELINISDRLLDEFKTMFALNNDGDKKRAKFLKLVGFSYLGDVGGHAVFVRIG